jgi:RNAse (barnase) inhibitor barstar
MELYAEEIPEFGVETFMADLDGSKCKSMRGFYNQISRTLLFPEYFGRNLDALFDCLCSLEVTGRSEVVLVIRNYARFLEKENTDKRLEVRDLLAQAEEPANRTDGIIFKVITMK